MERFYFHLHYATGDVEDREGTDLPDLQAAEREAEGAIRDLAADVFRGSDTFKLLGIRITDAAENLLCVKLSRETLENAVSPDVLSLGSGHVLPSAMPVSQVS